MHAPAQAKAPDLEVWWLHPAWLVSLMGLVVIPAAYLIPDWMYREYWRTPKRFDLEMMNVCLLCVAVFSAGAFAGSTRSHSEAAEERYAWTRGLPWVLLFQVFNWTFYLTAAGYAVWGASAVLRGLSPQVILSVLHGETGASDAMKNQYLGTISGVTTLTQVGLCTVVLGAWIGCVWGWRCVRVKVAVIFLLAVIRAWLNSERLAVIEIAIPLAVVLIRLIVLDSPRIAGLIRLLVLAAPVYAGAALMAIFAASEYFRSWLSYYAGGRLSFFEFVYLRLLGYYVTALNNGALMVARVQPTGAPFFTLHFLWRFPILSQIVKALYPDLPFGDEDTDPYMTILGVGANPEFNNPDGYLIPILDFGVFGALLYWLLLGLFCGYLYRLFCRKHPLGLTIYPLAFIGVVEMPRIIYWGEGRIFPAFLVFYLLSYFCVKARDSARELSYVRAETQDLDCHA